MQNIIASYITGTEQMPWECKRMFLPLMKHLSANVGSDRCREAAQVPFAFLDTLLLKQHSSQKYFLRVFHGGVWSHPPAEEHTAVPVVLSSPWILPLHHPERDGHCCSFHREQTLPSIRPPLHGRAGFWPPQEKLQHRAVRSSEEDAACI